MPKSNFTLIESDNFPFEFLSQVAERESWRKEVHRPVYHIHKWWAKRLGTVFRGILLACRLEPDADLESEFYKSHSFHGLTVFDPFMGSGTTIGEAHKLGFSALGRDINPVSFEAVRVALGPLDRRVIDYSFRDLTEEISPRIRQLYQAKDSRGRNCDVLYHFWVMQSSCPGCSETVDLFPTYMFSRNAYPARKPETQVVCPACGNIFQGLYGQSSCNCPECKHSFNPSEGPAKGAKAVCPSCMKKFSILDSVERKRPPFRHYAKLVLTREGKKEYLASTAEDQHLYRKCSSELEARVHNGDVVLPALELEPGYNTRQAMSYGFLAWRDFFNDRQLLALSLLRSAICDLRDENARRALLTLFSGALEFNNLFASYKGEGTGAVRHMFSHHILKPERMPIEANVWGTPKSSGSFSNLFRSRLLRAIDYREGPTEVNGPDTAKSRVCSPAFTGKVEPWGDPLHDRAVALSCGDSAKTGLADSSLDLVVTDPPFFDNVHYSELADFFFAWQQIGKTAKGATTRSKDEVQDTDSNRFSEKLMAVFRECHRVLKDEGLLVFTYHHSRDEGWKSLAEAIFRAGLVVVNTHPVKGEMSVATPKAQAKEPIQLDIIIVCRKAGSFNQNEVSPSGAIKSATAKLQRLSNAGFSLSRNDTKVVLFGQMLTTLTSDEDLDIVAKQVDHAISDLSIAMANSEFGETGGQQKAKRLKPIIAKDKQRTLFE